MNKKTNENKTKQRASANKNINSRAIGIWQRRMMGKEMQEIAKELNIHESTVWRNIKAVEQSGVLEDKIEIELAKQRELWGLALAGLIVNLKNADMQAIEKLFKYTGLWLDKIEVLGKVKPDDQQKRMMESVEKLLKIQAQPQQVEAKVVKTEPDLTDPSYKDEHDPLDPPKQVEPVQGTDGQGRCICGDWTDPACPVHGDKTPKTCCCSARNCLTKVTGHATWCPAYKKKEGGTPTTGGVKE